MFFKPCQHGIEEQKLSLARYQPGTKLTQYRVVKAWIVELQS